MFFLGLILSEILHPDFDKLGVVIYGGLGLSYLLMRGKTTYTQIELFFLLFVFYLFVSIPLYKHMAYTPVYSALFFLHFGILNYILINRSANSEYIKNLFITFVNWQSVVAVIGIIDFLLFYYGITSPIRDYDVSWKTDSLYSNPNPFGIMSAIALLLAINGYVSNKRYLPFAAVVNGLAIICSGSTMAILLPGVFYIAKLPAKIVLLTATICSLIVMVVLLSNGTQIDYIGLFNKRIEIWLYGLQMWESSPYVGIGTGNFQLYSYLIPGNEIIDNRYGLHSLYMWLIVETGVIGTIIFGIFIWRYFYSVQKYRKAKFLVPFMLVLLASQITEFYLDHEEIFILIFWATVAASIARTELSENKQYV